MTASSNRLLLTAFGRFDGGPNCSEALLDALRRDRRALKSIWRGPIAFQRLDVDTVAIESAFPKALRRKRPTHVLMMGQAAGRKALSFERLAHNRRDFGVADAAGRIGPLGPVREGGPDVRAANWPDLDGLAAAVSAHATPAIVSDDAGAHLCNQTLYLALEAAERAGQPFVATFLHLPLLPGQVALGVPAAQRAERPTVALDDMRRAVREILRHTRRDAPV